MAGHDHTIAVHDHSDAWHHHATAEGVPQHEHAATADAGLLLRWFMLFMVSGVVVIIALLMYFGKYSNTIRQERVETLDFYHQNAEPLLINAEAKLGVGKPISQYTYKAANAQDHTVQLPIEQAMQKVVENYGKK